MGCRYEYCIELRQKQGTVFELINNQWLVIVEIPNLLQMEFIMISKKVKIFVTWLITMSLSIVLSACQKKENSTNTTPAAPAALPDVQSNAGGTSGGGGIDGSGGDVERSSKQQVQAAIKNNLKMLQQALSVKTKNPTIIFLIYSSFVSSRPKSCWLLLKPVCLNKRKISFSY